MLNILSKYRQQKQTINSVSQKFKKQYRKRYINSVISNLRKQAVIGQVHQYYLQNYYSAQPSFNLYIPHCQYVAQANPYQNYQQQYHNYVINQMNNQIILPQLMIQNTMNAHVTSQLQLPKKLTQKKEQILFEVGNFCIFNKLIGRGTFSQVLEGINTNNNNKIAAKCVKKLQKQQIQCLITLNSPYIVKVIDVIYHKSKTYIILQFCQKNLKEQLQSINYQLPTILKYFEHIVQGLNQLQQRNILHRDLKFQNILINNKTAKLADFGLAKFLGDELQIQSRRCGTPYTMAPQIYFATTQTAYTSKCDIWSLGVLLHEMLYQKHPFNRSKQCLLNRKRVLIQKKFPFLDEIIDGCLIFNPSLRINWKNILKLFKSYSQIKGRISLIDILPITAQSQIYEVKPQKMNQENNEENNVVQYKKIIEQKKQNNNKRQIMQQIYNQSVYEPFTRTFKKQRYTKKQNQQKNINTHKKFKFYSDFKPKFYYNINNQPILRPNNYTSLKKQQLQEFNKKSMNVSQTQNQSIQKFQKPIKKQSASSFVFQVSALVIIIIFLIGLMLYI